MTRTLSTIDRRGAVRGLAVGLALVVGLSSVVVDAAPASDGAVQGPALPSVDDDPEPSGLPDVSPDATPELEPAPAFTPNADAEPSDASTVAPPPPSMQEPEQVRVAVGLSSELDGNKQERALLDTLEQAVMNSPAPKAEVRRLRVGSAPPKEVCREGRDDLVITLAAVPDEADPVLLTYDCRIDQELGMRRSVAADDPELLGVLWSEHRDRVAKGARERRRGRVSPKVRTGLIAGAAVAVIGIAVGLLIAGAVQKDSVVLVVGP